MDRISANPVFIVGCPRSGTTLLASLLEPSEFGAPVETHFIPKYYSKLAGYGDLSEKNNFKKLITDILKERPIMQWGINVDLDEFFQDFDNYNFAEIINKLCLLYSSARGKTSWGDKTPDYVLHIDLLTYLFPGAKFIYIVRDGRDVAMSLLQKKWGPNNVYSCAKLWVLLNSQFEGLRGVRNNNQLFEVKYEDLLSSPKEITKALYDFLGIPFPENLLKPLIEKINISNYNKWKSSMPENEIKIFESVAFKTLTNFGYEVSPDTISISDTQRIFWHWHDRFFYYKHFLYMNTVEAIKIKFFGMEPFSD